jgi:proliferating cell nuclear antigen
MAKFKALLDESEILKDSINAIANLLNEGLFKVNKSGIELKSMDAANVAMVDLKLLTSAFRNFDVDSDTDIGVNIADLTSVLKRAKPTESIGLELKGNSLHIEFSGGVNRAFNIPLLDIQQESKSPSLNFPATIELKTSVLEDGISDAEIISDAIVLEADPDTFVMRAEGESRKAELKLEKGHDSMINLKAKDHVKSTFPLDYLKKMVKAAKLSDSVILQLGNDYPLRMDFRVVDKVQLGFILAPRIESE